VIADGWIGNWPTYRTSEEQYGTNVIEFTPMTTKSPPESEKLITIYQRP